MDKNAYISQVEKVVKQILPKFVERFNAQHNFELPKFEIDIDGYPRNIWGYLNDPKNQIEFNTVYVKVKVQVKDGRLGRLKKLIKLVVEQSLDSVGFKYGEVYIDFEKELLNESNDLSDKLKDIIIKIIGNESSYKGWYSLPYSDSNDEKVDWYVEYKIKDIKLWKPNDEELRFCLKNTLITGTIYITITKILVGFEETNDWERLYNEHDLPSWCWDDLQENILNELETLIPQLCVDIEMDFKTKDEQVR